MPNKLNAAQSVAIIVALVGALNTSRARVKELQTKIEPTEAELAAAKAEDEEIEAALEAAQAALAEPTPDPTPDPEPTPDPAPPDEPPADSPPTEPDPVPAPTEPTP